MGEHLIRLSALFLQADYYGFYSNKSRGLRGQAQAPPGAATMAEAQRQGSPEALGRLDQTEVYEVDPLVCPKCGATMKIISFIERDQSEVIEKLRCAKRTFFV